MKKKNLKIVLILFVLICACFITTKTYAATATPTYKYNLIWNIASYYYYLDSTATKFATPIANAANNWVYTGHGWNNLYPNTRTTNLIDSACDFYGYSQADNVNGYTEFYKRANGHSGSISDANPNTMNWLFNRIYLNSKQMDKFSNTVKQGVVAHEFGHAFGLAHNNQNANSIMCQMGPAVGERRAVNTVQKVDQDAFNKKHP